MGASPPPAAAVRGYAVAVWEGSFITGWTHTTPLTLREAEHGLRHWQRRARLEDKGCLSYEVCEVRRL